MQYQDFEIRIGPRLGDGYPFVARAFEERTASGYFQMPFPEKEADGLLMALRSACADSDGQDLTIGADLGLPLEGLGRQLYDALFTPQIRAMYHRSLGRASGWLRLKMDIPQPELARLPWEYLHDEQRFLGLDLATPIVRGLVTRPWPMRQERPLRLLILGASPRDQAALDIDSEYHVIAAELAKMEARGDIVVRRLWGREVARDLPQHLWEFQPHVLHFAGHGTLDSLILEDGASRSRPMSGTSLRDLLGNIRSLKLVVLNACEMASMAQERRRLGVAARLVQVGIPMTVGMQFQISDPAALAFSEGFYEALAQNMPLEAATAWARMRISYYLSRQDRDTMEWGTPVIHVAAQPWPVEWRQVANQALAQRIRRGVVANLPESIVGLDGKEMRLVRAGPFVMGSHDGPEDERPQHRRELGHYWMDVYPVTNTEYAQFIQGSGHRPPSHWQDGEPPPDKLDHPVVNVSWRDAQAYAAWAGKRLPTEAEWEKAARGSDGRLWPWGNVFHPSRCNSRESQRRDTTPVDAHTPLGNSPHGVADMAGNVWEWTADRYAAYPGSNYVCDSYGEDNRVLRGGSWSYGGDFCRCATRTFDYPDFIFESYGFRCVSDASTIGAKGQADRDQTDGSRREE